MSLSHRSLRHLPLKGGGRSRSDREGVTENTIGSGGIDPLRLPPPSRGREAATPSPSSHPPPPPSSPPKSGRSDRAAIREGVPRFARTPVMTKRARRLRREPTDAEKKLWRALRRDQLDGLSFRRQHPVAPYVLDFYCRTAPLAIEVDGGQHADATKEHDVRRSAFLAAKGIAVVRFWNNDVLSNLEGVLSEIVRIASARVTPSRRAARVDLPLSGGGNGGGSAP